jgi:hypothetical protein
MTIMGHAGVNQSGKRDAACHTQSKTSHHETGGDIETADPAPQNAARHRNGYYDGEQKARRSQLEAESYEVSHEIGGEYGLDTIECKAGDGQTPKVGDFYNRSNGGPKIGESEASRGHAVIVEPGPQRLQRCREYNASGRYRQHRAAPSQSGGHRRAEKATDQQARGYRGLLDRKYQRRQARRRDPVKQLRTGRGRHRGPAAADDR